MHVLICRGVGLRAKKTEQSLGQFYNAGKMNTGVQGYVGNQNLKTSSPEKQ